MKHQTAEQLNIFDLIKEAEAEADNFDTLYDEVEEDPTADFDPNVEYFKLNEIAYHLSYDGATKGIVMRLMTIIQPARAAR